MERNHLWGVAMDLVWLCRGGVGGVSEGGEDPGAVEGGQMGG